MEKLAIFGGKPVLDGQLPETNNIGEEEKKSVMKVLNSGVLSDYLGRAGDKFLGGEKVLQLEDAFKKKFKVKYAVTFNSATTALEAAVCALGIGPDDEVIVSPYTMSASATAILMNMAIPVFADVEEDTFCLSPNSIKERITDKTKAIMVTNLFGGSARYDEILQIAKKNKLKIIEDNAQAPGGMYKNIYLGIIGDVGVFSFNIHKTMQSGEGGVLVTNNDKYAFRAQLRRNHGEQVLDDLADNVEAILGTNTRMTEYSAAIATEQLKKLDYLNEKRIEIADYLTKKLKRFKGITPVFVLPETKHVYYLYPIRFDEKKVGITRDLFARSMEKEGFALNQGYLKPLYLLNLFQNKKIFSNSNCPFDCNHHASDVDYTEGLCPVVERLWKEEFLCTSICRYPLSKEHIDLFIKAVEKIFSQIDELKRLDN